MKASVVGLFISVSFLLITEGIAVSQPHWNCPRADREAAEKLFFQGVRAKPESKAAAIQLIELARDRCKVVPQYHLELAKLYEEQGRWASAYREYEWVRAAVGLSAEKEEANLGSSRVHGRLRYISIDAPMRMVVNGVEADVEIELDGRKIESNRMKMPVDPGRHVLRFGIEGKERGAREVDIGLDDAETVRLITIRKEDIGVLPDKPSLLVSSDVTGLSLQLGPRPLVPNQKVYLDGPHGELTFSVPCKLPGKRPIDATRTSTVSISLADINGLVDAPCCPQPVTSTSSSLLRWAPPAILGLATAGLTVWYFGELSSEDKARNRVEASQRDPALYPVSVSQLNDAHDRRLHVGWALAGSAALFAGSAVVAYLTGSPSPEPKSVSLAAGLAPHAVSLGVQGRLD